MKRFPLLLILLASVLLTGCKGKNGNGNITVMTFNIRYDNPFDSINAWPNRAGIVCDLLKAEKPDLLGLQEAIWYQYEAIDSALSGYSSVAIGRDDGRRKGEMNPLFYNTYRFDYVTDSTFWLSATPDRPGSKGWGASLPRIVTWVELIDKKTYKPLFYFNTHFAHDSDSARIMSAEILLNKIKRIAGKNRFVVTGDFNMTMESKAYSILTESSSARPLLKDCYFISKTKPEGPTCTFNGWSDEPGKSRIDYIFVRTGIKVLSDSTLVEKAGPVFISDHWPVKAIISLK
jgi:endonuclease/exonuclease/phosphatase family metal-dependent hydrolase